MRRGAGGCEEDFEFLNFQLWIFRGMGRVAGASTGYLRFIYNLPSAREKFSSLKIDHGDLVERRVAEKFDI